MKEIRFSEHAQFKFEVLIKHGVTQNSDTVCQTIRFPDKTEFIQDDKIIAQKQLDEKLVLRVVYREYSTFILVITFYPGRRSRYEADSL